MLFCVDSCGEVAQTQVEKSEQDWLMRGTGSWADVAFKSADMEEGLSAHISRIRSLGPPRLAKGDGRKNRENAKHRDGNCDHGMERVRRANQKLIGFECGFIHEEGLQGRQWLEWHPVIGSVSDSSFLASSALY